jgi:hypothetical protein
MVGPMTVVIALLHSTNLHKQFEDRLPDGLLLSRAVRRATLNLQFNQVRSAYAIYYETILRV